VFVQCGHEERGASPDADIRTFWSKLGFFEIFGVSARTRGKGVEPVRIFCGHGERGSIFRHFVRTSFMDGPQEFIQLRFHRNNINILLPRNRFYLLLGAAYFKVFILHFTRSVFKLAVKIRILRKSLNLCDIFTYFLHLQYYYYITK